MKSVLSPLRPPDHIVVADNDSKDGTYEHMCKLLNVELIDHEGERGYPPKFEGKFHGVPITIFRKRLSSRAHSLNACLRMTPSDTSIVGFLNAEDWYAPDKILRSLRTFQKDMAIGVVVSDCDEYHDDGRVVRVFRRAFRQDTMLLIYPYDENFFIRTSVFNKLQAGFNESLEQREDYDMLLRASEIGLIYHIPEALHNRKVVDTPDAQVVEQAIRQQTIKRREQFVEKAQG